MKKYVFILFSLSMAILTSCNNSTQSRKSVDADSSYTHIEIHPSPTKIGEIPVPEGYQRLYADTNSFAYFLRELPLKASYADDEYHSDSYAVVELNIDQENEIKSSDAIIFLRSRYLYKNKEYKKIIYSGEKKGELYPYIEYARGDYSAEKFERYLNDLSRKIGSQTLRKQLRSKKVSNLAIGDVFIEEKEGKDDAHSVMVVDMAFNPVSRDTIFLLAQFDSNKQKMFILRNHVDKDISPWFSKDFGKYLFTPTWTFFRKDLKSFD